LTGEKRFIVVRGQKMLDCRGRFQMLNYEGEMSIPSQWSL